MHKRAKRILIICKGHQNVAGAQLYLKQIASIFNDRSYELHFALRKRDGQRVFNEIAKECLVYLWEYDWRHLAGHDSLVKGMKLIRRISPDIILFNSSEDRILWPIWAARLCGVPRRVMVVHWALSPNSLPLFRRRGRFRLPVPSRYSIKKRIFRALSFHLLNKIIFVNNMSRRAYLHLYKISPNHCLSIYNGIEVEAFANLNNRRAKTRHELGISSQECMVLATGNLTAVKGYAYLISAVNQLVEKGIAIKCFIAGQGELREDLERQIKKESLENHIKILGYRNDVPSLLAGADIFCIPSLNEALGYSLLEAIAAGIPVVASSVGGIPEVITHGREGLLVQAGDAHGLSQALEKLSSDADLRQKMGRKGQETAKEKFSLERMMNKTRHCLLKELNG